MIELLQCLFKIYWKSLSATSERGEMPMYRVLNEEITYLWFDQMLLGLLHPFCNQKICDIKFTDNSIALENARKTTNMVGLAF